MKKQVGLGFALALALVAVIGVAYWVGHEAGADSERSNATESIDEAAARTKKAKAKAYRRGMKVGQRRGYKEGHAAGLQDTEAQIPEPTTVPEPVVPSPNCPAGQEPTADGGCAPYDESDGQIEPKINDPACYTDQPPAGCF
jgi:hypothetical protein